MYFQLRYLHFAVGILKVNLNKHFIDINKHIKEHNVRFKNNAFKFK